MVREEKRRDIDEFQIIYIQLYTSSDRKHSQPDHDTIVIYQEFEFSMTLRFSITSLWKLSMSFIDVGVENNEKAHFHSTCKPDEMIKTKKNNKNFNSTSVLLHSIYLSKYQDNKQ